MADAASTATTAAPKKVSVKFLKGHRHDGIDQEKDDIITVHPKVAELLTKHNPPIAAIVTA
jgi:hypothetical protein